MCVCVCLHVVFVRFGLSPTRHLRADRQDNHRSCSFCCSTIAASHFYAVPVALHSRNLLESSVLSTQHKRQNSSMQDVASSVLSVGGVVSHRRVFRHVWPSTAHERSSTASTPFDFENDVRPARQSISSGSNACAGIGAGGGAAVVAGLGGAAAGGDGVVVASIAARDEAGLGAGGLELGRYGIGAGARVGFGEVVVGLCVGAGAGDGVLVVNTTVRTGLGLVGLTALTGTGELLVAASTPLAIVTGLCSGMGWLHGRYPLESLVWNFWQSRQGPLRHARSLLLLPRHAASAAIPMP